MRVLEGKSVFSGIAIGKISILQKADTSVKRTKVENPEAEITRVQEAKEKAVEQLQKLYDKALREVGESGAAIFEVHQMMLDDEDYLDSIDNIIRTENVNAEYAVATTGDNFADMFAQMDDDYMKARAADIKDISDRLVRVLSGHDEGDMDAAEPSIIVAEDLAPSETVQMDKSKVLAFVTRKGSSNSHTAILARTMNIPALINIEYDDSMDGKMAVVDGKTGSLIVEPDADTLKKYQDQKDEELRQRAMLKELKGKTTETKSGHKIHLYANIGSTGDVASVLANDAEGIGLFRSEFIYLEKDNYPTEEEQFQIYKAVAQNMAGKKVIIRTLDIGADKQIDYFDMAHEENPAMGYRAIRICLDRPEVFKTQLRALFRASMFGNISIMYPMIISVTEVKQIKAIVAEVKKELTEQKGEQYSFQAHSELLKDYMTKVRLGKTTLEEEKGCQERYSRFLQELDSYQEEKNKAEREVLQYENQFHEVKQETIESVYRWEKENAELHLQSDLLQEMAREIEKYTTETDYWNICGLANGEFERKSQELSGKVLQQSRELSDRRLEKDGICEELEQWKNQKEPEPERSEAVEKNRRLLKEKGIPYLQLYKVIDFDGKLDETQRAYLEEALLHMGILDALIVPEEYREQALALDAGVCDRYIFSDAAYVRNNIMDFQDVDNEEGDILLYQNVSRILTAIGWKEQDEETISESIEKNRTWIDKRGNYGIGIIEGTVTKNYTPCFIGAYAREQYRIKKIQELEAECRRLEDTIQIAEDEITQLKQRKSCLETEWKSFPKEQDLKVAAKKTNILEEIECKVQIQKGIVEKERKSLDAVRLRVQEVCQKCYLPPRLDVFTEAEESLTEYKEELMKVQISYGNYRNGISSAKVQKEYLEGIDADLDDIRYDLNHMIRNEREKRGSLNSVMEQLALTDYEEIRERLEHCIERLEKLPSEIEASVTQSSHLETKEKQFIEKLGDIEVSVGKYRQQKDRFCTAFEMEYQLGYVECPFAVSDDAEERAEKICRMFMGRFGNKRHSEILENLQNVYHMNRGYLLEYQVTLQSLFEELDEESGVFDTSMRRIDISAKYRGITIKFKELIARMKEDAEVQRRLLSDKDRELFEDILANTISKKIRGKIQASKRWVEKMNTLMESMKTSSGLTLSLRWKNKRAEKEEQLDTRELVELLQKDAEIMRPEEAQQLSGHFRSKIEEARKSANDLGNVQSFHAIMRNVLDYRQWFEFQLECQKTGEKKRELTDRVFFTFSGGEKAMSMYVPLFSAVVAKYAGARQDAPYLISLDEAFAGVDEMNIRDMFRLMVEFDFNFMINSQILWGDYDTVPALAIYQLVRPENAKYVTVIRYVWNGNIKSMVTEKDLSHG